MQLEFRLSKLSFQSSDAKNNLSIPEMPLVASMASHVVKKDHQKIESKINDGITSLTQVKLKTIFSLQYYLFV